MKTKFFNIALTACVLGLAAGMLIRLTPVRAATYTVNVNDDNNDRTCDTLHCSLREAINMANNHAGPDTIAFNIPGSSPHTIRLQTPLPALIDDSTTIAGETQPGYSVDLHYASGLRSRGRPTIVLEAYFMSGDHIFDIPCNENIIRNLSLVNFANGYDHRAVDITGSNNLIQGNFFGFYPDGRLGDSNDVIRLYGMNNLIKDNVLWGRKSGIEVWSGNGHVIQGNLIGTDPMGNSDANAVVGEDYGIITTYDNSNLLIGGPEPADRNVISGYSTGDGIFATFGVRIINNYIGTNADGNAAIPNQVGVRLNYHICQNLPPGSCTAAPTIVQGNLISANGAGIIAHTEGSIIKGNRIGTDATGTASLGYQEYGIASDNVRQVVIGGRNPGDGNLISGNRTGIYLRRDAEGIEVYGNQIGTDLSGTAAIPNNIGIKSESTGAIIGSPGAGNVISGNTIGVWITGRGNRVWANRIGTNAAGTSALPNYEGIRAEGNYDIDLSITNENQIAFNSSHGIHLINTIHVNIWQNFIYRNGADGIYLDQRGITYVDPNKNWFKENSIFSNGIRGIRFIVDGLNNGVEPPVFTRVTTTSADGTTCPNCHVEIFVSDRDSSGSGEGKTFITAVDAGSDGVFHADLDWSFRNCDTVTATATDSGMNTSEFSRNVGVSWCIMFTSMLSWILILGGAGGGSAFLIVIVFLLRKPRHQTGPGRTIGLGLLGGVIGAGIAIAFLASAFAQVEWPEEQQGGQSPAGSSCGQFVNENLLHPPDGAVFEPGTDVLFEISPQPDPPGIQTRWFLDVTGPGNNTVSKELSSNSIRLSDLGFDPKQTGVYFWTLRGERSQTGSNLWTPLCTDSVQRMFQIAAPQPVQPAATATIEPNEKATATPTVTPTLSEPTATLLQNANCRRGPGTEYDAVTTIPNGSNVPIVGRNQDNSWWQVQVPGGQIQCWVGGETVETSGDTTGVPIVEPPPLGCWVKPLQGPNKCEVPCPEGAQPGGACES